VGTSRCEPVVEDVERLVRLGPERVERVSALGRSAGGVRASRASPGGTRRGCPLCSGSRRSRVETPAASAMSAGVAVSRVEVCEFVAHDHEAARSSRESGVDGEQRRERFELRRCGAVIQRPPRVHAQLGLQSRWAMSDQASISQAELVVGPGVRRRLDRLLSESVADGVAKPARDLLLHGRASNLRFLLATFKTARFGPIGTEQLWNRVGATDGKRSAIRKAGNGLI
jgi:hypothetical protein